MAQLNLRRFGINEDNASSYDYILGFDLGHGEISVSYWKFKETPNITPDDLNVNDNSDKKDYTVLFRQSNGEFLTGHKAIYGADGQLFSGFKVKPSRLNELYADTQVTKKELIQQLLVETLKQVRQYNTRKDFFSGKGLLVIGCPSSPDWLAKDADLKYAKIFQDVVVRSGLDLTVMIMPESRASLVKVYKESTGNENFLNSLHDGVIVFDFGSSTLDATSIDFDTNTQKDKSIPLGAHLIEELLLKVFLLENNCSREDLYSFEKAKLEARRIKEVFYDGKGAPQPFSLILKNNKIASLLITPELMHYITDIEKVGYSTDTEPFVEGTWAGLCKIFMNGVRQDWLAEVGKQNFKGLILLTGGASRMGFVEELAKGLFPHAKVHRDGDPSYCVSRGLAYAANADLQAIKLVKTAKERINNSIKSNLPQLRDCIATELDKEVYAYVDEKIADWVVNGNHATLSKMLNEATSHFYASKKRGERVQSGIQKALSLYMNDTGENGLKNVIITTINELFKDVFPGQVSHNSLGTFDISGTEWEKTIGSMTSTDMITFVHIAKHIDLESTISHVLKHNFVSGVVYLTAILLTSIVDGVAGTSISDKLEEWFSDNKDKVLSQQQRQKILVNYRKEKVKNIQIIHEAIKMSCVSSTDSNDGKPSTEDKVVNDIIQNLDGVIDKAINNVSLYF